MKDLNIVIVNYYMSEDCLALLGDIERDTTDAPFSIQVTLVDNSENLDGIHDELRAQFPSVKYIDAGGNVGFGRANTIGFKATPARYYLTINPDTRLVEAKTIERLYQFLTTHPQIGAAGPKLTHPDGTLQYTCYRFDVRAMLVKPFRHLGLNERSTRVRRLIDHLEMRDFDHNTTRPVDWIQGAVMMVRHEAAKEVGWFDQGYFMYFEDCDWCHSLWHKHWPVYYVHDIVLTHRLTRGSSAVPGVFRALVSNPLARAHIASWFRYLWKWRRDHRFYVTK